MLESAAVSNAEQKRSRGSIRVCGEKGNRQGQFLAKANLKRLANWSGAARDPEAPIRIGGLRAEGLKEKNDRKARRTGLRRIKLHFLGNRSSLGLCCEAIVRCIREPKTRSR